MTIVSTINCIVTGQATILNQNVEKWGEKSKKNSISHASVQNCRAKIGKKANASPMAMAFTKNHLLSAVFRSVATPF